jgi:two-component system phosphate regulon sensor histidine kinase PhoR
LAASIGAEVDATLGEERIIVSTDEAIVQGDRQQLDQVIRNLIDNSMKYGDPKQPVEVHVARDGREAVLSVTDHGEGIHPDHIPYLTRRFYRTDPGRSRMAGAPALALPSSSTSSSAIAANSTSPVSWAAARRSRFDWDSSRCP